MVEHENAAVRAFSNIIERVSDSQQRFSVMIHLRGDGMLWKTSPFGQDSSPNLIQ